MLDVLHLLDHGALPRARSRQMPTRTGTDRLQLSGAVVLEGWSLQPAEPGLSASAGRALHHGAGRPHLAHRRPLGRGHRSTWRRGWGQESGVRSQGSGVRSQGSGVRSQGSGVRGQESGVRSQGSGVRSQGSGQGQGGALTSAGQLPASSFQYRVPRHRPPSAPGGHRPGDLCHRFAGTTRPNCWPTGCAWASG